MNSKECEEDHTCIICAGWCRQFFFLKAAVGSIVKTFASKLVEEFDKNKSHIEFSQSSVRIRLFYSQISA